MNTELLNKVMPIAKSVRAWTQAKANRANYNPDNLCGWCAISAAHLFRQLSKAGIKSELHYVPGHCFVVVEDHVVDVTATQFRYYERTEIMIAHIKEVDHNWYYQTSKIFDNPSKLRDHQLKNNWPRREIAYTR